MRRDMRQDTRWDTSWHTEDARSAGYEGWDTKRDAWRVMRRHKVVGNTDTSGTWDTRWDMRHAVERQGVIVRS